MVHPVHQVHRVHQGGRCEVHQVHCVRCPGRAIRIASMNPMPPVHLAPADLMHLVRPVHLMNPLVLL